MIRLSKRTLMLAVAVVAVIGGVAWSRVRPSNDRLWVPQQAVLPEAKVDGHLVHVRNVRNFQYTAGDTFTPAYYDRTYDLDKLVSASFILSPFSERWRGPAHSFVTFQFADSQFVAISVEARKEPGENYAVLTGLLKRFELMYVVGDERDLIGGRALLADDPLYLYPIRASPDRIRQVFVEMMQRAERLRTHPEFYNTVTNNCTSNVIAHVNRVAPGRIPGGLKTILPGYSDEVGIKLGLLDTDLDLERARERFRINEIARQYANDPAFSFRIREAQAVPASPAAP